MSRLALFALLGLMLACGAAVWVGQPGDDVSFDSAREIWADLLRDADDVGLQATRVPAAEEMQLGAQMAAQTNDFGAEDPVATRYVQAVGDGLAPFVNRPAIRYRFHVVESPEINAFALPGGQIYVFTGMLEFAQSEAELAAVLGHEMSHVDLRHCIERYQYELALRKAGAGGVGAVVGLAHQLAALAYTPDQELEADAGGERLAIEAGYDPDAAAALFNRLMVQAGEVNPPPADTPAGEVGQAAVKTIVAFFRTHPTSQERARKLAAMVDDNRQRLQGRQVYIGVRNYREKIPRSQETFPEEQRTY